MVTARTVIGNPTSYFVADERGNVTVPPPGTTWSACTDPSRMTLTVSVATWLMDTDAATPPVLEESVSKSLSNASTKYWNVPFTLRLTTT